MKRWNARAVATISVIVFLLLIPTRDKEGRVDHRTIGDKDTLTCYINIPGDAFAFEDFPIGFNYHLLTTYAQTQNFTRNIIAPFYKQTPWQELVDGKIDIVAMNLVRDTIPFEFAEYLSHSALISDEFAWVVRADNDSLLDNINFWIGNFAVTYDFFNLEKRFLRAYRIEPHLINMTFTPLISPYDVSIKKYSHQLGWDWRLLAAVIYQESRFSMGAVSSRGATGLMQVLPSTARHYGIDDVFNPDNNIHAGVSHLKYLQKIFVSMGMSQEEIINFTLAAYNAGEGRIQQCIEFARGIGKDPMYWKNICESIPYMSDPKKYLGEETSIRKFSGKETIKYVEEVLRRFEEYKMSVLP